MTRLTPYLIIILVLVFSCNNSDKKETKTDESPKITTYYLIRHAEKDRTNPENSNPPLNETGKERAQQWARYFDTISLDAVYATQYMRTEMTAKPTAESKNLDVQSYDPNNLYGSDFREATHLKSILVVGHSNTTPSFVNKIMGVPKYKDMDDNDNSTLYVVKVHNTLTMVEVRQVPLSSMN